MAEIAILLLRVVIATAIGRIADEFAPMTRSTAGWPSDSDRHRRRAAPRPAVDTHDQRTDRTHLGAVAHDHSAWRRRGTQIV